MKYHSKVIPMYGDQGWKSGLTLTYREKGFWDCFPHYETVWEGPNREPPKLKKWLFIIKDEYLIVIVWRNKMV